MHGDSGGRRIAVPRVSHITALYLITSVCGVPDLATNVMTLTATALVADSAVASGRSENWRRRAASIAIFLVGATVGAGLTTRVGPWAPLALTVALFTVALTELIVWPDR
jgi:uncharacterized membrane protein YoaK (UPF0700 family)